MQPSSIISTRRCAILTATNQYWFQNTVLCSVLASRPSYSEFEPQAGSQSRSYMHVPSKNRTRNI
jgi:hypothetical protein